MADEEPTNVTEETIVEETEPSVEVPASAPENAPESAAESAPESAPENPPENAAETAPADGEKEGAQAQTEDTSAPVVNAENQQDLPQPSENAESEVKEDAAQEEQPPPDASTTVEASGSKVAVSASATAVGSKSNVGESSPSKSKVVGSATKVASTGAVTSSSKMAVSPSKMGISSSRMEIERRGSKGDERASATRRRFSAERRASAAKRMLSGSIMSIRRQSLEVEKARIPRYMNSYRLDSKNPFKPERVTAILREVLTKELEDTHYDPATTPKLAMTLSSEIRARVKVQQYDRYKIVCVVDIGEKQMQSIYSAFRFLWDIERDKYAMFKYENMTLFAVACCFGIYYE